jgi:adenine-specific DNA-methyltransferase
MPTLNWIGKEAVVEHHRHVPTRLLECDLDLSAGDPDAENLLVEGDNLEALKALLPRYRGQVKCIYIDPPYNTGNEGWVYNDNVNDPRIMDEAAQGRACDSQCHLGRPPDRRAMLATPPRSR